MFNNVTSERLKTLPSVEGVDSKRIPQILSQVYAHVVGLKAKYDVGVLSFEAEEIGEDYQMLSDLAFTLELYLESGRFVEQKDSIAFVAAMSHKLMNKLKEQEVYPLTSDAVPSDVVSVLMFIIGGYIADAEEVSQQIKSIEGESETAKQLKLFICLLARGRLKEIVEAVPVRIDEAEVVTYAEDLLWQQLALGIKILAIRLTGGKARDYRRVFQRAIDLAVYVDEDTHYRYDFVGVSRLARLLMMAAEVLERQSVLSVVGGSITTSKQYDLLLQIISHRPYLWQNHIDAIEKGFLKAGVSSVITFPTGAGKSTLVELKVIQHIALGGKVAYIVPTHALEHQVKNNMARLLGTTAYRDLNIGREFTTEDEDEETVMVMTPERCSTLLTLNPSSFDGVSLVMMDEFHIIGDGSHRSLGAMYCLLSLLITLPDADFVLVSAMVENGAELSGWIAETTGRECLDLSMVWKPTSQLQGCIVYPMKRRRELAALANDDYRNKGKRKGPSAALKRQLTADPYCLFSLCNTWESDSFGDYYLTPMLDHQVLLGVNQYWRLNGNRNQVAKELAKKLAAIGMKTIVFVENPVQANNLVKELNTETRVESLPRIIQRRRESIVTEFGEEDCSYLEEEMGAVPHHSLLLNEERYAMEALFRKKSDIMVATPTLAQGVNLPVDVVLIAGEDRYDAETKGRGQMDAHEILNAAGRAGRAGFRSQGAAIIVSNKVIGIEENTLTGDWFDLKKNIFSKGDQCLKVEDPLIELAAINEEDGEITTEQKNVLMKLNLAGVEEKTIISKSLYAYQLKQQEKNTNPFVERISELASLYSGEGHTPLLELSLKTGIDIQLLDNFYKWLEAKEADESYTVEKVLELYCSWLKDTPQSLLQLLTYETTSRLLLDLFAVEEFDVGFIEDLKKVLNMYINGETLKEISMLLAEKPNDPHLTATRKLILRVIPELSYAFSVLAMVHVQFLVDCCWNRYEIPSGIKNFSTYLKEGVTSEAMLRFKTNRRLMRVECHNLFEG